MPESGPSDEFYRLPTQALLKCVTSFNNNNNNTSGGSGDTLFFNSVDFGKGWESFSYTSTPEYGGRIDLGFGKIEIAQDGISPIDLKAMLISGRNNGSWDGEVGFTTSQSINTIKNIGYANLLAGGGGIITKVPGPALNILPPGGTCIAIVSFSFTYTIFSFISRGNTGQQLSFSGASAGTLAAKFI